MATPDHLKRRQLTGKVLAGSFVFIVVVIVVSLLSTQSNSSSPASLVLEFPTASPTPPTPSLPSATMFPTTSGLGCNGLEQLCDVRVNELLFATVHNAASTRQDGTVLLPNHEKSLELALQAGYRGINVDIGICDGEIRLVHGVCGATRDLVTTFRNIANFLESRPNDVLLMPTQIDENTGGTVTLAEIDALITEQVPEFKSLMYNHDPDLLLWPTLAELIDVDKRILFFHYNGERCVGENATDCPEGFNDWFQYAAESAFSFSSTDVIADKNASCSITRGGDGRKDFYGVNVFTEIPSDESCSVLNDRAILEEHISACADFTNQSVKLLLVDCWDIGDVVSVVQQYNRELV